MGFTQDIQSLLPPDHIAVLASPFKMSFDFEAASGVD
jgi:hypothetical protein